MPAKRPLPLSDAALGHKGEGATGDMTNQSIGETNDGQPLPVKNTFIDVPSGFSPATTPTDHSQPVSTAPAQVHYQQGFLKRAVLDSVEETSAAPDGLGSQGAQAPPSRSNLANHLVSATPPLMTPSPTGTSLFSDTRYQLFGGPMPLKEAPLTVAPCPASGRAAGDGLLLSVAAPKQAPALDMPYSHQGNHFQSPYGSLFGPDVDSAGALGAEFARLALGKADSDDEDEDSEAERQQAALAASGRTIETAPKPPPGALHPSMGSAFHDSGNCKRCCFYPRNRCLNGYECEFCHYEHEKRKRKNKKNKKKKAEAGDPMDDFFNEGAGLSDLAWPNLPPMPIPPCHGPLPHPPHPPHAMHPACPPYMDAPLTYQWTDGMPGQTPAPPIIPGYEEYVAACCSRRLPGIEPPALATNPPPQAPYFDDRAPGYPFEPPQLPPYYGAPAPTAGAGAGALDPAAAPWVPPTSPYTPAQASNAKTQPSRDTEEGASSKLLGTSLSPPLEAAEVGQASMPQTSSGLPEKEASDTPLPLNLEPNMPPPDSSPKLNSDLVALQNPPPPDQSPTLPT